MSGDANGSTDTDVVGATLKARARQKRILWVILVIWVASVIAGALIAHAAGANSDMTVLAGAAGPVLIWLVMLFGLVAYSCVKLFKDSRRG